MEVYATKGCQIKLLRVSTKEGELEPPKKN